MCACNPLRRTPFCGGPGCKPPPSRPQIVDTGAQAAPAVPTALPGFQRPPAPGLKVDAYAALAAVSGLSAEECRRLAVEVQANQALLAACPRHDFADALDADGARVRPRWRCRTCTGWVDASAKVWYERGLAARAVAP